MVRNFNIRDMKNKHKIMGRIQYDTDTKQFRIWVLNNYKGKSPDLFMIRCNQLGIEEMPEWMVERWIRQRLCDHTVKT